jgi:hypothetical protein
VRDAYQTLGAKFIVVADAPLRQPACLIEGAVQAKFQPIKFGLRLWRCVAEGMTSEKLAIDPVYVFLTYLALDEPAMPGPDGVIERIKCQGTWLRVMH